MVLVCNEDGRKETEVHLGSFILEKKEDREPKGWNMLRSGETLLETSPRMYKELKDSDT